MDEAVGAASLPRWPAAACGALLDAGVKISTAGVPGCGRACRGTVSLRATGKWGLTSARAGGGEASGWAIWVGCRWLGIGRSGHPPVAGGDAGGPIVGHWLGCRAFLPCEARLIPVWRVRGSPDWGLRDQL